MPYCSNCGSSVGETHHYCSSCGNALSKTARSEDNPPMVVARDGFLSPRSLSYVSALLSGEQTIDRESVSHRQLQRDVNAAFSDFARIAMVEDLNLLLLWASGSGSTSMDTPIEDMNSQQFQDWLASMGLIRTLQLYDDAFGTDFRSGFNEKLQELIEIAREEIDDSDGASPKEN